MKINKIHHIAIIASNYSKSKNFYVNILGCEIMNEIYREERQSYKLDLGFAGNYCIELFSFPNPPKRINNPEAAGLRHLAFEVDDIEDAVTTLKNKGVEVEPVRIDPVTEKKYTFFKDPDDLPLEVYEK